MEFEPIPFGLRSEAPTATLPWRPVRQHGLCATEMVIAVTLLLKKNVAAYGGDCERLKTIDNSAMKADHGHNHKHHQ